MSIFSQFWMVWAQGHRPPEFKHATIEQAKAEAERLARTVPGTAFIVLEAVAAVKKTDVEWADPVSEMDVPF